MMNSRLVLALFVLGTVMAIANGAAKKAKKPTCKQRVQRIKTTFNTIAKVEKDCKVKISVPGCDKPQIVSNVWRTYVRWGRTTCPQKAQLVYEGAAGGAAHTHPGSGSNYVCLPKEPEWDKFVPGTSGAGAYMYGAEYELIASHANNPFQAVNAPDKTDANSLHDHNVPCVVCRVPKSDILMIPAKTSCPDSFDVEYKGYLVGEHHKHPNNKDFVCMDKAPETLQGGHTDQNGALFYSVQARCGSLPCPNYIEGRELTCVVCSI